MSFLGKMFSPGDIGREQRIAQQKQLRELEAEKREQKGLTAEREARTKLAERRQAATRTTSRRGLLTYANDDQLATKLG